MDQPPLKDHVVIISHDIVGHYMAGPGVRYYHFARILSQEFPTLLLIPNEAEDLGNEHSFHVRTYRRASWESLITWFKNARVLILPGALAADFYPYEKLLPPVVIDAYNPLLPEWLAATQFRPEEQRRFWPAEMKRLSVQYLLGDFFICASERQRDYLLGLLEAHGRINPWTFQQDTTLRTLIDVVSYGVPEYPPAASQPVIKGVWPGIAPQDTLVLWGGGLWPWTDPLTAIRAINLLRHRRPDIRLLFPGTRHPNPELHNFPSYLQEAQEIARQQGLLNSFVFFGEWIPYSQWPGVLLESDAALSLHQPDAFETRWAFRTRLLDYIWAGIPIVSSRGDATSDLVAQHRLGALVTNTPQAVSQALDRVLATPISQWESSFAQARQALTWPQVLQPLIRFCRQPNRAADKQHLQPASPYYQEQIKHLSQQVQFLEQQVQAYQRRKVVRLADTLSRLLQTVRRLPWLNR